MSQRATGFTFGVAILVLLAMPGSARPTAEADDRIPVTDPSMLEALGLEPGATNVYMTPEVHAYLLMSPAERAAANASEEAMEEAHGSVSLAAESSSAFGSTAGVSTIHASDFTAQNPSSATYAYPLFGVYLNCSSGNANFRGIFRDVPHGARLTVRRVWYYDDTADQDITVWLERICIPFFSAGDAEVTVLRMNTSSGTPGFGRFGPGTFIQEDVDNQSCVYGLRARLSNDNFCQQGGNPTVMRLYKASLSWQRQVSPAPGTATFGDVPTGHPFFQHIEALAGSEITSGCGGGDFCPGSPVTRGQMARFLATALGLDWEGPFWTPAP